MASHMRAMALVPAGRIRDAELDARLGFDYKLAAAPIDVVLWPLHTLVDALVELDELDDAEAALAAAGQQGDPPPGAAGAPLLLQSRARLRLAQHRARGRARRRARRRRPLGRARRPATPASPAGASTPPTRSLRSATPSALTSSPTSTSRSPTGSACAARPEPGCAPSPAPLHRPSGSPCSNVPPPCSRAQPDRLEHARALVDLGAALRRANRRADARAPLRRALDLADRGGMRRLARRARHELRAAGARPRRTALSGIAALTPAEHRVAALAADGHSNREIAQRLYVTTRTVETHLTHAFQKLDITSRAELAGGFADHDQQDGTSTPSPPIPPADLENACMPSERRARRASLCRRIHHTLGPVVGRCPLGGMAARRCTQWDRRWRSLLDRRSGRWSVGVERDVRGRGHLSFRAVVDQERAGDRAGRGEDGAGEQGRVHAVDVVGG